MIPVTAAVIYKDEHVLIARRGPEKHLAGYWEFPGGKIELGETPEACLLREIEEELGIHIQVDDFLMESIYDYGHKTVSLKAYRCTYLHGGITLSDHDDVHWVLPERLSEYRLAPADIPFIATLTKT
ncbi:(deoxy)nucleoside triphosphate pyrophosphohydrolase [Mucilaginibacter sp. HD30]